MTAPTPNPRIVTTEQVVSCLPFEHDLHRVLSVRLRRARDGRWTVTAQGELLNSDGDRHEGPSDEVDTFTEYEALQLAAQIVPTLTVNGLTAADVLARAEVRGR